MIIHQATLSDLDLLVPLFDGYRLFYRQQSDLIGARQFLHDRITAKESVVFIALLQSSPVGRESRELDLPQSSPAGRESRELDLPQSSPVGRESRELDFAKAEEIKAVGFTQLYPIFSSVSMERMLLLNDLFIDPEHRGQGIGKALIDTAKDLCRTTRQKGIVLQTETNNPAQRLYEREGFTKDPDLHYFWKSNA